MAKKKSYVWYKTKLKGFTLLECLLAIVIITTSFSLYQNLGKVLATNVVYLSQNQQRDWLLFSQQLRQELAGTKLLKVENNKLYVKLGKQELAFGQSRSDDFRKTNANGQGYQPMLYQLKTSRMTEENGLVTIELIFRSGLKRTFIYAFEKTS
ncbi:competence type IV pilus minor pilin ComGF [Streptococcus sp. sy010]|uniref:competence type IV pilus minor pilin ComGF n=1 Tax=Streptococcus sp. sy010 TaxID=2600148 RepID=UPI0011B7CB90|nr:competence type IV pilus minor pilin ComGF [Streptococcus sp. sy010]TWT13387.1 prepilin-type N-terminal cleavage/methylation domain-containing protein [Streptococcus sp. sy010]